MKKVLVLFLVAMLLFSVTSCSTDVPENEAESEADETKATEVEENEASETETADEDSQGAEDEESASDVNLADLEAMNSVEKNDTFLAKVTKAEKAPGLFDDGSAVVSLEGEDGVVLTVENLTVNTINEFTVLVLATDSDGKGRDFGTLQGLNQSVSFDGTVVSSYSNYVKVMGTKTADLAPGKSDSYSIKCNLDNIENVNAIVYSYVDSNGNEIVNNACAQWLSYTTETTTY